MSDEQAPSIVNVDQVAEVDRQMGDHWGAPYKILTPSMRPRGGKLGVNQMRVPPGRAACPFHSHQLEDEVFYILSGKGLFRSGDTVTEVSSGDCISCPAGSGEAHQLGNPFDEDLVYLAIGNFEPHEVCVYPDNQKVLVRSLQRIGQLDQRDYMDGEPERPRILDLKPTR